MSRGIAVGVFCAKLAQFASHKAVKRLPYRLNHDHLNADSLAV